MCKSSFGTQRQRHWKKSWPKPRKSKWRLCSHDGHRQDNERQINPGTMQGAVVEIPAEVIEAVNVDDEVDGDEDEDGTRGKMLRPKFQTQLGTRHRDSLRDSAFVAVDEATWHDSVPHR